MTCIGCSGPSHHPSCPARGVTDPDDWHTVTPFPIPGHTLECLCAWWREDVGPCVVDVPAPTDVGRHGPESHGARCACAICHSRNHGAWSRFRHGECACGAVPVWSRPTTDGMDHGPRVCRSRA